MLKRLKAGSFRNDLKKLKLILISIAAAIILIVAILTFVHSVIFSASSTPSVVATVKDIQVSDNVVSFKIFSPDYALVIRNVDFPVSKEERTLFVSAYKGLIRKERTSNGDRDYLHGIYGGEETTKVV